MNVNKNEGESYVRRQVKASPVGSTEGSGKSRSLFRRAFATRGASSRSNGSGAPSSRRSTLVALAAAVLAIAIFLGAASAIADEPPVVTISNSPTAEYTTAEVSGTVNPSGGPSTTYWHFEYTTTPDEEFSWQYGPGGEIAGPDAEGTSPVPVSGKIEYLQPETEYSVRLVAENGEFTNRVVTEAPYPTFTTEGPVTKPSVSIDPVTTFDGTTAEFSGKINPGASGTTDPGFDVNWHFQCTPECPNGQLSGHISADDSEHTVEGNAIGLEPNTDYSVELVASNAAGDESAGPVSFHTTAVAPNAETLPAFAIQGGTEALVGARINPHNSATTYWIEYGPTTAYSKTVPLSRDASAGSGGSSQLFTEKIAGLTPSTVYHFRVVAENASGEVEGDDKNFETAPAGPASEPSCPNAALRAENNSTALPDCRAYEKVSPEDKNGFDAGAVGEIMQPNYVASTLGSALAFESFGAFGDARAAGLLNQYLSRRTSGGWETHGLTPPQLPSASGNVPLIPWYSPDLRYGMVAGGNQGHLAEGDNAEIPNLYRLDTLAGVYRTLNLGAHPDKEGGFFKVGGGSADGTRLFFETTDPLVPGAVDGFNGSGGRLPNLYEWHEGQLRLVSVIINSEGEEEPAPEGGFLTGYGLETTHNAVSADGSRIIFQDFKTRDLYLRENGVRSVNLGPANFAGASTDTSKIFFTTTANLTGDATGESGKLYRYDADTGSLTNLVAGTLPGSEQRVTEVAGVSEDGEWVYFRSPAHFHPGDNQGPGEGIFVWHNGTVKFIASDDGDIDANVGREPFAGSTAQAPYTTYRISPDGTKLSFDSNGQLTSYDNTDAVSTDNGSPHRDGEVYVYDAALDRLTCVSCNPTGERPTGAPNGGPAANSTFPRPPSMAPGNMQPGVRNDGSVFFNSRDALVPQDVNGKMDVYQWKGDRVHLISSGAGGGDSFLASASADSTDVYFQTRDRLVASDRDENSDLYDARVGGGFPKEVEPSLCEGIEGCHGPASGSPPTDNPGSSSFSSPLKQPSPKALRLRKALKACKHKKTKKAKARCRAAAKRRYGAATKSRHGKAAHKRHGKHSTGRAH